MLNPANPIALCFSMLCVLSTVSVAQIPTSQPIAASRPNLPPDKNPMATTQPAVHSRNSHEAFLARATQGNVNLVFIGDSITAGWRDNAIWQQYYTPLRAVNFGIGGDTIQNVLWRVGHGEIDPAVIQPKVIVLLIGTNNVGGDSTRDIVAGLKNLVAAIRETAPQSKLLLLGIFPCQERQNRWRRQIEDVNSQISALDDGKTIRFLDLSAKFVNADGTISKEIMPDFLHLSPKGYAIWAEGMQPLLAEMMGLPASAPDAEK